MFSCIDTQINVHYINRNTKKEETVEFRNEMHDITVQKKGEK